MKKLTKMNTFSLGSIKNKTIVCCFSARLLMGFVFLILIQTSVSLAYIPELPFILKKATNLTGRKIIQIEQEVIFKVGEEEARVDEIWLIEGDKNLKVSVAGKNLFKDSIKLNYLYNGKNKTFINGKNKNTSVVGTDFFQRYLFIRSKDSFMGYLKELNIVPEVKLSRADGVISFLIGQPSDQNLNPQIWIGQDDFVLRKIRMPSAAEVSLDQITSVSNDIFVAKVQTISWQNGNPITVQIKIKKIDPQAAGSITSFYPQNLDMPSEINFANKTPLTNVIEEFYSRFR